MREVKFRAWNHDHSEMIYSSPNMIFEKREFYALRFDVGFSCYPETDWILMQNIGLKDKNGKEIYEGDILQEGKYNFLVIWNKNKARFELKHDARHYQYPEWNRGILMQIIGNIHENPELFWNNNTKWDKEESD